MKAIFASVVVSSWLFAPSMALADCDYCVNGITTCTHSGWFAVCGEGGRIQCGIEYGGSVSFGKCGPPYAMNYQNNLISVRKGKNYTVITMPNQAAQTFLSGQTN
jgi:hypothetical protein